MNKQSHFVGIDLGTTMSVVSYVDSAGVITTLPNEEGDALTPSAIYLDQSEVVIGKAAKDAMAHVPDMVAFAIKRDIGRSSYCRPINGRHFRPETLSALILKKLKQDTERQIGAVSRVVITVPAYFDDTRRKATQDAGRIAGFDDVLIINEPTAAALAYSIDGQLRAGKSLSEARAGCDETVLVYDLGGGTFDVTLVKLSADKISILVTDGAVELGGKDWDERIVEVLSDALHTKYGAELDAIRKVALATHAEGAKKLLSRIPTTTIECALGDQIVRMSLTRERFEELTFDLLAQSEAITNLVLEQAGLAPEQLDRTLLVGGSTRMPMVSDMLQRVTGKRPDRSLDPDQAVARGAAIFAAIQWSGDESWDATNGISRKLNVDVVDVNSHSLGVSARHPKTRERVNAVLIPKNSPLPVASSRVFRLNEAGTSSVRVRILEGEAPDADANIQLGECLVTQLSKELPKASPVQVWLSYETNGRVGVTALDMTGGRIARTEIHRDSGLTEADILREQEIVAELNVT